MVKVAEAAVFPLIILCGGLLEAFFEHPVLYMFVFTVTILCCMVIATRH